MNKPTITSDPGIENLRTCLGDQLVGAVRGINTRIAKIKEPCNQQNGSATEAETAHTHENVEGGDHSPSPMAAMQASMAASISASFAASPTRAHWRRTAYSWCSFNPSSCMAPPLPPSPRSRTRL